MFVFYDGDYWDTSCVHGKIVDYLHQQEDDRKYGFE